MSSPIRNTILSAALAFPVGAAPAPEPRELRVALVGDSLAYGAGDEAGKGIAGRLEPELRNRGVDTLVTTNLAVNGATTRDLAAALRRPATRKALEGADAVVLSIGANDVRRTILGREPLRSPLLVADEVLQSIDGIVAEIRGMNQRARILILGGYIPVAHDQATVFLEPLVAIWDASLAAQFAHDPLVSIVQLSDIIDGPARLSKLDGFHPGGEAYQHAAQRIAHLLTRK